MTRHNLGSTDAAPILAATLGPSGAPLCSSPWRSSHDLWRALRGHETPTSPAMTRGLACEPHLARRISGYVGADLEPIAPIEHPHGVPFLRVSGDYRVGGTGYELKTSSFYAHERWAALPDYYHVQAVLQAWAFDLDEVIVPALVLPSWVGAAETSTLTLSPVDRDRTIYALAPLMVEVSEIQVYRVERDDDYARAVVAIMGQWWDRHIVHGEEPAITATDAFAHYARVELREREPLRPATVDEIALAERYVVARDKATAAAKAQADIGAQLRAAIGTAAGLKTGHGYAVARTQSPRTDWKAVAAEMGAVLGLHGIDPREIVTKHTTPSEGRTLAVTINEAAMSGERAA